MHLITCIQYEVEVEDARHKLIRQVFYGRLDLILECELEDIKFWGMLRGKRLLLALLTPSSTNGKDATKKVVTYVETTTQIVTDLQAVSCVVGRIQTRNRWGIIDHSGDLARTEFIQSRDDYFVASDTDEE